MDDCKHGIPVTACADCNPRFLPPPEYGPWCEAHYPGDCAQCDGEIRPGDTIRSDGDGGWLCGICGDRGGGLVTISVQGGYL